MPTFRPPVFRGVHTRLGIRGSNPRGSNRQERGHPGSQTGPQGRTTAEEPPPPQAVAAGGGAAPTAMARRRAAPAEVRGPPPERGVCEDEVPAERHDAELNVVRQRPVHQDHPRPHRPQPRLAAAPLHVVGKDEESLGAGGAHQLGGLEVV
eukprot:CAMPEP_0172181318 /NCGR_PEP_ID=MMETSP1050-20130122/17746_1 /TAXON_ID=233186 /ORGANISM="Cryptomonas curvata, Strain CCAP979/52" /LENGTH=150 /DNA_ID=CAMNT_0012854577 /DNA_START=38 /DNA_END=487 /DNA_ORIENTATION=-